MHGRHKMQQSRQAPLDLFPGPIRLATAEQVWREEGATSRALCAIHALDYACFTRVPVSDICQSVSTDAMFRNKLLEAATTSQVTNATKHMIHVEEIFP